MRNRLKEKHLAPRSCDDLMAGLVSCLGSRTQKDPNRQVLLKPSVPAAPAWLHSSAECGRTYRDLQLCREGDGLGVRGLGHHLFVHQLVMLLLCATGS